DVGCIVGTQRNICEALDNAFRASRRISADDRKIETGVVAGIRADLDRIIVAPAPGIARADGQSTTAAGRNRYLAWSRRGTAIESKPGDRHRSGDGRDGSAGAVRHQSNDVCLLSAVRKELTDRVTEIAARVQAAEQSLVID